MNVEFEDEIKTRLPGLQVLVVEADIENRPTDDAVDALIADTERDVAARFAIEQIKQRPGIAATRAAYKTLGKEPNRYRPSTEALCRRIVRGLGLYRVDAAVDVINVLSILTGYSIGGFDADRIAGETITLGVGRHGEPYEAIGRGELNIEHLPVFRDAVGGIGTPTSDNERTKLSTDTRRLLMTINIYGEEMSVDDTRRLTQRLLETYLNASSINFFLARPQ